MNCWTDLNAVNPRQIATTDSPAASGVGGGNLYSRQRGTHTPRLRDHHSEMDFPLIFHDDVQ